GLTVRDAVARFLNVYNSLVDSASSSTQVLRLGHGYSTSENPKAVTIKNILRVISQEFSNQMTLYPSGPGASLVIPTSKLPAFTEELWLSLRETLLTGS